MTKKDHKPTPTPAKDTNSPDPMIQALEAKLARAVADYANLEKRFQRDSSHVIKFATANLITKLLDLRDNLDLSDQSLNDQGISMLLAQLHKIIQEEGVVKVDTSGDFDPTCMECSELVAGKQGQIIATTRTGYKLHDRVLRTASVVIGSGSSKGSDPKGLKSKT